jgi:uncharacterized protein YuzE
MDLRFDGVADAAYLGLTEVAPGEAVEQVTVGRGRRRWWPWRRPQAAGYVILDFDRNGVLLGVEVVGARALLRPSTLDQATRIDEGA